MDDKTIESLFLNKLYSLSKQELRDRLDNVPSTGLGELLHEDAVYSRLESNGMSLSNPMHRVKLPSQRNNAKYVSYSISLFDCSSNFEHDSSLEMAA
jgi:hypothetical protein